MNSMQIQPVDHDPYAKRLFSGNPLAELLAGQREKALRRRKREGHERWAAALSTNVELALVEYTPVVPRINWSAEHETASALQIEAYNDDGFFYTTSPALLVHIPIVGDERLLLRRPRSRATDWPHMSTAEEGALLYQFSGDAVPAPTWESSGQSAFDLRSAMATSQFRADVRRTLIEVSDEVAEWRAALAIELATAA